MLEYIVFFGLLAAGIIPYLLYTFSPKTTKPVKNPIVRERYKCESPIERRLYDALVFRGHYVATQVPCGKYRIDLALTGPRIAIDCDGKAYHSSPEQKAHDRRKNRYLKKNGWRVMRFSGRQINGNIGHVLRRIEEALK